jgi:hypothetical protein
MDRFRNLNCKSPLKGEKCFTIQDMIKKENSGNIANWSIKEIQNMRLTDSWRKESQEVGR